VRLYKDSTSGELGLCIHFISFTKRWLDREIDRRERKKNEIQEEQEREREQASKQVRRGD